MENKKYFLSRVSSTEEYVEVYFCYIEIENLKKFLLDLKKMKKVFSDAQLITPISSMDFPEPDSVKTFYLNSDENDFLEDLFEQHEKVQNRCFVELSEQISADFLDDNECEASINEYKIRFIDENWACFVGKYKHFYGEVETDAICRDLLSGDQPECEKTNGDYKFSCSVCGSENVAGKCWANPNTDEVIDYISSESQDNYCEDCGKAVTLMTLDIETRITLAS
ncbi:MAG: hypothetical protein ACR2MD_06200 [Aridibacter sp.]